MEPTPHSTEYRPTRHHHYPSMTGEERLEALRSIKGMWKGKGKDIMEQIESGREDRNLSSDDD